MDIKGIDKNYRLSFTEKAERIVEGLSLEEKVSLMSGKFSAIDMIANFHCENHYNYIPYPAGGIEEKAYHRCCFVMVQEESYAEQVRVHAIRCLC